MENCGIYLRILAILDDFGGYIALLKFAHFGKTLVGGLTSRICLECSPIIPNDVHGRGIKENGSGPM